MLNSELVLTLWDILSKSDHLSGIIWSCCGSKVIVKNKLDLLETLRLRGLVYSSFVEFCQVLSQNCFSEDEIIPGVYYHKHFLRDDPSKLSFIGVSSKRSEFSISNESAKLNSSDHDREASDDTRGSSGRFYLNMSRLLLCTMTSFCDQLASIKSELSDLKNKIDVGSRAADLKYEQMAQKHKQLKNEVKDLKTKLKTSSQSDSDCACAKSNNSTKTTLNGNKNPSPSPYLYMTSLNQRIRERLLKLNDFTAAKLGNPSFLEEYFRLKLIPFLFLLNNNFQRGIDLLQKPVASHCKGNQNNTSQTVNNSNQNNNDQCHPKVLVDIHNGSTSTEVVKSGSARSPTRHEIVAAQKNSNYSPKLTCANRNNSPVFGEKHFAIGSKIGALPPWTVKIGNEIISQNNYIKNVPKNFEGRSSPTTNEKKSSTKITTATCDSSMKKEPAEVDNVPHNQKFVPQKQMTHSNVAKQNNQLISTIKPSTYQAESFQTMALPVAKVVQDILGRSSNTGQTSLIKDVPRRFGPNCARFLNNRCSQKAFPSFGGSVKTRLRNSDSSLKRPFIQTAKSAAATFIPPPPKKMDIGKNKNTSNQVSLPKTAANYSDGNSKYPFLKQLMEKVNAKGTSAYFKDKPLVSYPDLLKLPHLTVFSVPNQRPAILNKSPCPSITQSSSHSWRIKVQQMGKNFSSKDANVFTRMQCEESADVAESDTQEKLGASYGSTSASSGSERNDVEGASKESATEDRSRACSLNDLENNEQTEDCTDKNKKSEQNSRRCFKQVSDVRVKQENEDKEIDPFLMHF